MKLPLLAIEQRDVRFTSPCLGGDLTRPKKDDLFGH